MSSEYYVCMPDDDPSNNLLNKYIFRTHFRDHKILKLEAMVYAGGPSLKENMERSLKTDRGWDELYIQTYCWVPVHMTHLYSNITIDLGAQNICEQLGKSDFTSFSRQPNRYLESIDHMFPETEIPKGPHVYIVAFDHEFDMTSRAKDAYIPSLVGDARLVIEVSHKRHTTFEINHIYVSTPEWQDGYWIRKEDIEIYFQGTETPGFSQYQPTDGLGHFLGIIHGNIGKGYFSALIPKEEFQKHAHLLPKERLYNCASQRVARLSKTLYEIPEEKLDIVQTPRVMELLDELESIVYTAKMAEEAIHDLLS